MRSFASALAVLTMLIVGCLVGCSNTGGSGKQEMKDAVTVQAEDPKGRISIKKELLGKDLIFGGYITNFESEQDYVNASGLIGQFLGTRLIKLELTVDDNDKPVLSMLRSDKRPWIGSENGSTMTTLMANIKIESDTGTELVIKGDELAKGLSAVMETEGFKGSASGPQILPGLRVSGDSFIIPVEQRWNVALDQGIGRPPLMWRLGVQTTYFMKLRTENKEFEKRRANASLGYFTLEDMYYKSGPSYQNLVHFRPETTILRWDLNKTVTYVLAKNTPERYRPLIKEGIESWNKVLSDATGTPKKYIEVVDETKERPAALGDPNVNVIYWESDETKGDAMMYASWSNDPLTGEIFNTHVYIGGYQLVKGLEEIYDYYIGKVSHGNHSTKDQVSAFLNLELGDKVSFQQRMKVLKNLSGKKDVSISFGNQKFNSICDRGVENSPSEILGEKPVLSREEYVNAWIKEAVVHEVGHNLGLRHNFKGSLSYVSGKSPTNAIMDYNTSAMYMRGDSKAEPAAYEIQAINYGYAGKLPEKGQELPFCTDDDTLPFNGIVGYDAKCSRFDEGPNPLQKLVKNLRASYIMLNSETDQFEREERIAGFGSNLAILSIQYGSSPLVSAADKKMLSDTIADLVNMTEFQSASGENVNFAQANPYFSSIRLATAALYVYYGANWQLDEGPSISSKLGDTIASLLTDRSANGTSFAQSGSLLDIIVKIGTGTANKSNQQQLWMALDKADSRINSLMTAKGNDVYQHQSLQRLKQLVQDRKRVFIGKVTKE